MTNMLDFKKSQKTFVYTEWPVGETHEWIPPLSTGPGKDSKRAVDGDKYFKRVKQQHYYKNTTNNMNR